MLRERLRTARNGACRRRRLRLVGRGEGQGELVGGVAAPLFVVVLEPYAFEVGERDGSGGRFCAR